MLLLLTCLIACMGINSCCHTSQIEHYQPQLPPVPELADPGRPIANGDERDELVIIMKQAYTIEELLNWIDTVKKITSSKIITEKSEDKDNN